MKFICAILCIFLCVKCLRCIKCYKCSGVENCKILKDTQTCDIQNQNCLIKYLKTARIIIERFCGENCYLNSSQLSCESCKEKLCNANVSNGMEWRSSPKLQKRYSTFQCYDCHKANCSISLTKCPVNTFKCYVSKVMKSETESAIHQGCGECPIEGIRSECKLCFTTKCNAERTFKSVGQLFEEGFFTTERKGIMMTPPRMPFLCYVCRDADCTAAEYHVMTKCTTKEKCFSRLKDLNEPASAVARGCGKCNVHEEKCVNCGYHLCNAADKYGTGEMQDYSIQDGFLNIRDVSKNRVSTAVGNVYIIALFVTLCQVYGVYLIKFY